MKELVLIILFSILTVAFINAQIYIGINSKIEFPTGNYAEVDNGIGIDLLLGYSVNKKIDFNITASSSWYNTFIEEYKIRALNANIRYFVLQKSFKPYFGFNTGYFQKSYKAVFEDTYSENGIGIAPSIGILFDTRLIKGLYVNTELSYLKVYTKNQISLINFNIGLLFYFENKG